MSRITGISLLILLLGTLLGLFALGGLAGAIIGFILSGMVAIFFYCLAHVLKASTVSAPVDPFSDQVQAQNDRSQLPKGAYEPLSGGGL